MKIRPVNSSNNNSFKGALNNKFLLKGLETIANHSATFSATTALVMSLTLRPFVIKKTPQVEDKNKKYSIASSVSSGITKFLAVEAIAYPIEKAAMAIEKNKNLFLNKKSSEFFKNSPESFGFMSQILKQGTNFISAVPKSLASVFLIPFFMDKLFLNKENKKEKENNEQKPINFKGDSSNFLTKAVSGYFNNEKIQNFANNHVNNSKNIARNMMIASDALLTAFSVFNIKRNKKIDKKSKNNLIYNNILSSGFSIIASFALDKTVQKSSGKLIENFKKANAANPKLDKYLQGINVLRPVIIFSLVYYGILPIFSNFFAQKITDKTANLKEKN